MRTLATVDELDATVIPLPEGRPCDKCGNWTWWMQKGQRTLGRCLPCMDLPMTKDVAQALAQRTEALLVTHFGELGVVGDPPLMKAGVYAQRGEYVLVDAVWVASGRINRYWTVRTPDDAGPCVDCRGIIRRYGTRGRMRCVDCEAKR